MVSRNDTRRWHLGSYRLRCGYRSRRLGDSHSGRYTIFRRLFCRWLPMMLGIELMSVGIVLLVIGFLHSYLHRK